MVDIRESPSGPLVTTGGGETAVTLTSVRYVDPATTLDPDSQTGSEVAPYETLQQAIDSIALAGLTNATIVCIDGDYGSAGAEYAPVEDDVLQIVGFGSAQNIGDFVITGGSGSSRLTCQNLSFASSAFTLTSNTTGGTYEFVGMGFTGNITAPSSTVTLRDAELTGNIDTSFLSLYDSTITGDIGTDAEVVQLDVIGSEITGNINGTNLLVQSSIISSGTITFSSAIEAYGSSLPDAAGGGFTNITAYGCSLDSLTCTAATLNGCTTVQLATEIGLIIGGSISSTVGSLSLTFVGVNIPSGGIIAAETAIFEGCTITSTISVTAVLIFTACKFLDSSQITPSLGNAITIQGSFMTNSVTFPDGAIDNLRIDTTSWYNMLAEGITGPNGSTTVNNLTYVDGALGATISIVVPAVAAGAVGYVDTTLVGTDLEDLLQFPSDAVIVNPTSDLVAAGAGGGFLNARLSAANTLRSTFIGPLAGGAANFLVVRAR